MQRFNIYNFCSTFQMKAALTGVFHDGGYKVASDAIVLFAGKADYPEVLEHRIIGRDGREVIAKYPLWRSCIPDGRDYKSYTINLAKYESFIKERRQAWKESTGHGTRWQDIWAVKVGPAYLKAKNFDKFIAGMKEIGASEVYVRDNRRTVYAKSDKGWVLIFPLFTIRDESDKDTVILS